MKIFITLVTALFILIKINAQTDWHITGNAGTVASTNFLGTTDVKDLIFKTNSVERGRILSNGIWRFGIAGNFAKIDSAGKLTFSGTGAYQVSANKYVFQFSGNPNYGLFFNSTDLQYEFRNGSAASAFSVNANTGNIYLTNAVYLNGNRFIDNSNLNTHVGYLAGMADAGNYNTAVGTQTLYSNTSGEKNTALGDKALYSTTYGSGNTATGNSALYINTTGFNNTANGNSTLYSNTTGTGNTASGSFALNKNTTGRSNTANGNLALYSNTTGFSNIAVGVYALYNNTTKSNLVAVGDSALYNNGIGATFGFHATNNTAIGSKALFSNTTGDKNSANGYSALYSNSTGYYNTANGSQALYLTTTGNSNSANGYRALYFNNSGNSNTANGVYTLYYNTTGNYNTANGTNALYSNTTGFSNVAVGVSALFSSQANSNNIAIGDSALLNYNDASETDYMVAVGTKALRNNTTGYYNTAIGGNALSGIATGNGNTAIGYNANVNGANRINATAIGFNAIATADNQVMLGNSEVTSVMAAGNLVIYSDGRFKKNMKENVPGLDFIKQLKPVTYNYDMHGLNKLISAKEEPAGERLNSDRAKQYEDAISRKEKKIYTGFVAQEVEQAADKLGFDFSGVYKPQNDKDVYGLSYADFVVPLVKAVQELSKSNDDKDAKIDAQQKQIDELRSLMQMLQQCSPCSQSPAITSGSSNSKLQTIVISEASLEQNIPNPFNHTTTINYTLPRQFSNAEIVISDKSGKILKQVNISGRGKGSINIDASTLSTGAYHYSLYAGGRLIDTKQMQLLK